MKKVHKKAQESNKRHEEKHAEEIQKRLNLIDKLDVEGVGNYLDGLDPSNSEFALERRCIDYAVENHSSDRKYYHATKHITEELKEVVRGGENFFLYNPHLDNFKIFVKVHNKIHNFFNRIHYNDKVFNMGY